MTIPDKSFTWVSGQTYALLVLFWFFAGFCVGVGWATQ
jgi:hypothetical protein